MYYSTELGTFEKDGAKYHVRFVGSIYELESESPQSMCPCKEYPSSNHYYGNEPHIRCEHLDDQGKILKFFEVSGEMTLNNKSNIELFKEQKVTYFSDFEEKDVFRAIEVSFNSIHDRYKLSEDIHLALVSKLIFQSYDEYAGEFPENGVFYRDKMVSIFNDKGIHTMIPTDRLRCVGKVIINSWLISSVLVKKTDMIIRLDTNYYQAEIAWKRSIRF